MGKYNVCEVYPTIQGEGRHTGIPIMLVRLQGCGVGCPWCDTKHSWHLDMTKKVDDLRLASGMESCDPYNVDDATGTDLWCRVTAEEIADYCYTTAKEIAADGSMSNPPPETVLITGGEPATHDLHKLVHELKRRGFMVHLETSGTALGHLGIDWDWVCVSPKYGMPGGLSVRPQAMLKADEIKWIVGRESDVESVLKILGQAEKYLRPDVIISVQPLSLSEAATEVCRAAAEEHGWSVSLQQHKLQGLP